MSDVKPERTTTIPEAVSELTFEETVTTVATSMKTNTLALVKAKLKSGQFVKDVVDNTQPGDTWQKVAADVAKQYALEAMKMTRDDLVKQGLGHLTADPQVNAFYIHIVFDVIVPVLSGDVLGIATRIVESGVLQDLKSDIDVFTRDNIRETYLEMNGHRSGNEVLENIAEGAFEGRRDAIEDRVEDMVEQFSPDEKTAPQDVRNGEGRDGGDTQSVGSPGRDPRRDQDDESGGSKPGGAPTPPTGGRQDVDDQIPTPVPSGGNGNEGGTTTPAADGPRAEQGEEPAGEATEEESEPAPSQPGETQQGGEEEEPSSTEYYEWDPSRPPDQRLKKDDDSGGGSQGGKPSSSEEKKPEREKPAEDDESDASDMNTGAEGDGNTDTDMSGSDTGDDADEYTPPGAPMLPEVSEEEIAAKLAYRRESLVLKDGTSWQPTAAEAAAFVTAATKLVWETVSYPADGAGDAGNGMTVEEAMKAILEKPEEFWDTDGPTPLPDGLAAEDGPPTNTFMDAAPDMLV